MSTWCIEILYSANIRAHTIWKEGDREGEGDIDKERETHTVHSHFHFIWGAKPHLVYVKNSKSCRLLKQTRHNETNKLCYVVCIRVGGCGDNAYQN